MMQWDTGGNHWIVEAPEDFDGWKIVWVGTIPKRHVVLIERALQKRQGKEVRLIHTSPELIPLPPKIETGIIFMTPDFSVQMCKLHNGKPWLYNVLPVLGFIPVREMTIVEVYSILYNYVILRDYGSTTSAET